MSHFDFTFETSRATKTIYVVCDNIFKEELINEWRSTPNVLLIDDVFSRLHAEVVQCIITEIKPLGVMTIHAGEACKSLRYLTDIFDFLIETSLPKHGMIIAVGGGTVCDVANIAAQLFRRGVGLALVPTTLLAQIDAAVGGKNGLNYDDTKNLLGQFNHAWRVVCDVQLLSTLERRQVIGGFAEAIKVFAVSDAAALRRYFGPRPSSLESFSPEALLGLVSTALQLKLSLVASDPFEESSRRLLNYGHAFAHTFEEESGFLLTHGEAVLLGMTIENAIAKELGFAGAYIDDVQRMINEYINDNCLRYWLDSDIIKSLLDKLIASRRNRMNLVCLTTPGNAQIIDHADSQVIISAWNKSFRIVKDSVRQKLHA